jgi:hypothetical protein
VFLTSGLAIGSQPLAFSPMELSSVGKKLCSRTQHTELLCGGTLNKCQVDDTKTQASWTNRRPLLRDIQLWNSLEEVFLWLYCTHFLSLYTVLPSLLLHMCATRALLINFLLVNFYLIVVSLRAWTAFWINRTMEQKHVILPVELETTCKGWRNLLTKTLTKTICRLPDWLMS